MAQSQLPFPPHFEPEKAGKIWRVPYQERAKQAQRWRQKHDLQAVQNDKLGICLITVDVQNTFCIPGFELFVAGRSGTGAVDDNRRLSEFIYVNLHLITQICPTMDTHQPIQIFHSVFLVNKKGEHPDPYSIISEEDIRKGVWTINPEICSQLNIDETYGQNHLFNYTRKLKEGKKYDWTIWPYHAMLGGIGHALVSTVEEAIFFHSIARNSQPNFQVKGNNPFTEQYSALGPEVLEEPDKKPLLKKNTQFIDIVTQFDLVIIAGQAKSHCVAWTIEDLLEDPLIQERGFTNKVYLLEDCTSPVVVPDVVDYTDQTEATFRKFSAAGIHLVRSSDPIEAWPDIPL